MDIKVVSRRLIVQQRAIRRGTKYAAVYAAIRRMPYSKALIVRLDRPNRTFGQAVHSNLRLNREGYKLKVFRRDENYAVWAILKARVKR